MDTNAFIRNIQTLSHLSEDQVTRTIAIAEFMTPEERSELFKKLEALNKQLAKAVKQLGDATIELQDIQNDAHRIQLSQKEQADCSSQASSDAISAVSQKIKTL